MLTFFSENKRKALRKASHKGESSQTRLWQQQQWKYCSHFFENPEIVADILQIPFELIKSLSLLLLAIVCQLPLDPIKYRNAAEQVKNLWLKHLSWYPMSVSLHMAIEHGK